MNDIIVAKFGGTSLADAVQFRKVQSIISSDEHRRYVVPSAPGKRSKSDTKITDLLYSCYDLAQKGTSFDDTFNIIAGRYIEIVQELSINLNIEHYLNEVRDKIAKGASRDYAASRGEYLNGLILADLIGFEFVDAAEVILFDGYGNFDGDRAKNAIHSKLSGIEKAVIPGFYGSLPDGSIKTFSRGGSDITGAIVANGVNAVLYENWTDVSGFLMADPRIVDDPKNIAKVTYKELRELACMGATVLHEESIFPVKQAGIPINIKNTNAPDNPGTLIVSDDAEIDEIGAITGIAGKKGYTAITIHSKNVNTEAGFVSKVLSIFQKFGVSVEHINMGVDSICIIAASSISDDRIDKVIEQIETDCSPESIKLDSDLALFSVVGSGIANSKEALACIFDSLCEEKIGIRIIDMGSSQMSITLGVYAGDFEKAINAIYNGFVR